MNHASALFRLAALALAVGTLSIAQADHPMRGPLPQKQREIIHYMGEHHGELVREVKVLKNGYSANTTTKNKELAAKMKEHFNYMRNRLGSGAMVRRWRPSIC